MCYYVQSYDRTVILKKIAILSSEKHEDDRQFDRDFRVLIH